MFFFQAILFLLGFVGVSPAYSLTLVEKTEVVIALPDVGGGNFSVTPYFRSRDGLVVLHIQPKKPQQYDLFFDARTGRAAEVTAKQLIDDFSVIEQISPADDKDKIDPITAKQLRYIGCHAKVRYCSLSVESAIAALIYSPIEGAFKVEVIDFRRLHNGLLGVLSGELLGDAVDIDDEAWAWFDAAFSTLRNRWLVSIRSITTAEQLMKLRQSCKMPSGICRQSFFRFPVVVGRGKLLDYLNGGYIDIPSEIERLFIMINVKGLSNAWLATEKIDYLEKLLELLEAAYTNDKLTQGASIYALEALMEERDSSRIKKLATALRGSLSAGKRVQCYSDWILGGAGAGNCGAIRLFEAQANHSSVSELEHVTSPKNKRSQNNRVSDVLVQRGVDGKMMDGGDERVADNSLQELSWIKKTANSLSLLLFNESTGLMYPESGVNFHGYSFVAKSLGSIGSGRFSIKIYPNKQAPVLITRGSYRVKVLFSLDYLREDSCSSGFFCRFKEPERYAKNIKSETTFVVNPSNKHIDERLVVFQHLQPLILSGEKRYSSEIKNARLAVVGVSFEVF